MSARPSLPRSGDQRGVVAVETALVIPVVLLVLGGLLVLGLHAVQAVQAERAAQAGLRAAVVRETLQTWPDDPPYAPTHPTSRYRNAAAVRDAVDRVLPGTPRSVEVTAVPGRMPSGAVRRRSQGDLVTVTVVADVPAVQAASRFVPGLGPALARRLGTVRASVQGRLE